MQACGVRHKTYDFSGSYDTTVNSEIRVIPFDDYFPRVHSLFIQKFVIPEILKAEKRFRQGSYKSSCAKKKKFPTEEEATFYSIHSIHEDRKNVSVVRTYYCDNCESYHITSKMDVPFIRNRVHKRACTVITYANHRTIVEDWLTGDSIFISYRVRKNSRNQNISLENLVFTIGTGDNVNNVPIDLDNIGISGVHESIVHMSTVPLLVNSSHTVIPDKDYLNVHKFVSWLGRLTSSRNVKYACARSDSGEHGVIIESNNQSYVARLFMVNNSYKLHLVVVTGGKIDKDNVMVGNSSYRVNSPVFIKSHKNRHRAKLSLG